MKQVDSLCPYCGVGCSITYTSIRSSNTIVQVAGRDSPVNHGRLCVKGRYGFDYAHHQERLTVPLIRKPEYYPKAVEGLSDLTDPREAFREATWDEALDMAAQRFMAIKQQFGGPGPGRIRLGQVLERRQLSLSEADPRGVRHQ